MSYTYKIFEVTEEVALQTDLGREYEGGVVADGLSGLDDEPLLLVAYQHKKTPSPNTLLPKGWRIKFLKVKEKDIIVAVHPNHNARYALLTELPLSFDYWRGLVQWPG